MTGTEEPSIPGDKENGNKQQSKAFQYANRISALAVVVAAISACFTGYLAYRAKDTADKQLRAYVHAVPLNVYHIDGKSGRLQAYVGIRNAGQTFAHDVKRSIGIIIAGRELPDVIPKIDDEPGKLVVGPGGTNIVIRNGPQLTPEESKQILKPLASRTDKDLRIYVIGKITYDDVWGEHHKTDFCFMYYGYEHIPNFKPMSYSGKLHGKYCDKHNSAD